MGPGIEIQVMQEPPGEKALEACEISRSIFRPLCEVNPVQNFLMQKIPGATPPPPLWGFGRMREKQQKANDLGAP